MQSVCQKREILLLGTVPNRFSLSNWCLRNLLLCNVRWWSTFYDFKLNLSHCLWYIRIFLCLFFPNSFYISLLILLLPILRPHFHKMIQIPPYKASNIIIKNRIKIIGQWLYRFTCVLDFFPLLINVIKLFRRVCVC